MAVESVRLRDSSARRSRGLLHERNCDFVRRPIWRWNVFTRRRRSRCYQGKLASERHRRDTARGRLGTFTRLRLTKASVGGRNRPSAQLLPQLFAVTGGTLYLEGMADLAGTHDRALNAADQPAHSSPSDAQRDSQLEKFSQRFLFGGLQQKPRGRFDLRQRLR